jgi:hypothetical protein
MTVAFDSLRRSAAVAFVAIVIAAACTEADVRTDDTRDPIVGIETTWATTSTTTAPPATTAHVSPSSTEVTTASTAATTSTTSSTTTSTVSPPIVTTTTLPPAPVRPGKLLGGWVAAEQPLFFVSDDPAWRLETFRLDQSPFSTPGGPDMVLVGEGTIVDRPVATLQVGPLGAYPPAGVTEPVRVDDVDATGIVASETLLSGVEWPGPDGYVASLYGRGLDLGTVVELANHVHFDGTIPVFDPVAGFRPVDPPGSPSRHVSADFVSDGAVVSVSCENSGEGGLAIQTQGSHTARSVAGVVVAQPDDRPANWSSMTGASWSAGGWWCRLWTYMVTGGQVPEEVVDGLLSTLTIVDEQTVRERALSATIPALSDGEDDPVATEDGVFAADAAGMEMATPRLTSDGTRLIVSGAGSVRVIDVASGRTLGEYAVAPGGAVFTDDDRLFFDGASVRTLSNGAQVTRIAPEGFYGGCATFSEDGRQIALVSSSEVAVYDVATGRRRSVAPPPADPKWMPLGCTDFVRNDTRLFVARGLPVCCGSPSSGPTGSAVIWDLASGRSLLTVDIQGLYSSAVLSPDERHVAVGGASDTGSSYGLLVSARTGDIVLELPRPVQAFSNDGSRFALRAADDTGDFEVWDATSLTKLATIPARAFTTLGPDNFSPDGSRVISLVDGVAEVRDIASGVLVGRLQLDGDDVRMFSARYSRDGSEIISVNTDATVRIWPAP